MEKRSIVTVLSHILVDHVVRCRALRAGGPKTWSKYSRFNEEHVMCCCYVWSKVCCTNLIEDESVKNNNNNYCSNSTCNYIRINQISEVKDLTF